MLSPSGLMQSGLERSDRDIRCTLRSLVPRLKRFTKDVGQDLLTPCSHNSSFTLEQISSVVKTRVTSPVRRCGPGHPSRAKIGAMVNAAESRRHLECRSFKTRTTDHYTQVDCSPFGILFPAWAACFHPGNLT